MPIVYVCNNGQCSTQSRLVASGRCTNCNRALQYSWEDDVESDDLVGYDIKDASGAVAHLTGHLATMGASLGSREIVHIKKLAASQADYRPQKAGDYICEHDSEKNGGVYQSIFYKVVVKGQEIDVVGLGYHEGKGAKYRVTWASGTSSTITL